MSLVITGASGQLGRRAVEETLARVDAEDLILVTRTPNAVSEYAERGVDVRHGDFDDPTSLPKAFAGGERLLLISTAATGARVAQHRAAIDAAVTAGVGFIAYTSFARPEIGNPAAIVADHRATEQLLKESGLAYTFLRNSPYADLEAASLVACLASGKLVTNTGSGRVSYVARRDCAAAAAAVLASSGDALRDYEITGPEALDAEARAVIVGEIGGRVIDVAHVNDEAFAAGLAGRAGVPLAVARAFASLGRAARDGYLDSVREDFQALTGRAPLTLRDVLNEQRVVMAP